MMSSASNVTMVRSHSAEECLLLIRKNSITKRRYSLPTETKSLQPPSDPLECMSLKRFNSGVAAGEESHSAECVPNNDVSSYESCCNNDDDDVFTDADSVDDYSDTSSNSADNEESEDEDGGYLSMPSSCCFT